MTLHVSPYGVQNALPGCIFAWDLEPARFRRWKDRHES
jgi:hypothetical protein